MNDILFFIYIGVMMLGSGFMIGLEVGTPHKTDPVEPENEPPVRQPNSYSKDGSYLIEHERPGSEFPYKVWPVKEKVLLRGGFDGFTFATYAEAKEFADRLEGTYKP